MSAGRNPRRANGHRRDQVRAQVLREEDTCWLCGQPVDKTIKTPDPMSPEVDEVIPVRDGGDPFDRRNCRLAHRSCNVARNRKRPTRSQVSSLITTRDWTRGGSPANTLGPLLA